MLKTLIKIRLQGILFKQTTSSKKKRSGFGKIILMSLLFIYVAVVFSIMFGMLFFALIKPFQMLGIEWLYFALMSLIIIMLCFVGSVFLVHHEIYEAKDNDILLSLPIKNRDILLSRVFVILILNYIYEILVAGPAFVVYFTQVGMNILQVILFVGVFLTLPLFVLSISCLFGWILAHVLIHVKMKNVITIVLFVIFMFAYFYAVQYIQTYVSWLIMHGESLARSIEKSVYPIYHLALSLQTGNILSFMIYLICALIPFVIVIYLLSRHFIKLATTKPQVKKVKYTASPMKQRNIKTALLMRELKHFTSNAMVMLNGAVGILMGIIALIAMFIYKDTIMITIEQLTVLVPQMQDYIAPILCAVIMGISSMNMITASSISLEGDRLWIVKVLPIATKNILDMKIAMHLLLCIPIGLILSIAGSIMLNLDVLEIVIVCILPAAFTTFVALMGLLLNLLRPKFDWVNETVCVKQSMPVLITMLISMAMVFVLCFVYLQINTVISVMMYMVMITAIFMIVDIIFYYMICTWGVRRFEEL